MNLSPEQAFIFRITHVDNVPWLLDHGLHCQSSSVHDPSFVPIGLAGLISKRTTRPVPAGPGGVLADYVPFYFTPSSIMLYNVTTGYGDVIRRPNAEIVILVGSLRDAAARGLRFVFTNGHAYPRETDFYDDLVDLDKVDWPILQRRDFRRDPQDPAKLTRYQAEALLHQHVPLDALRGIACNAPATKDRIEREVAARALGVPVKCLPSWYF